MESMALYICPEQWHVSKFKTRRSALVLKAWSWGLGSIPDTLELGSLPVTPLRFEEEHLYHLPDYKHTFVGRIYATRSISATNAEVIVVFPLLSDIIFMHAPLEALDPSVTSASVYFPFYMRLPPTCGSDTSWRRDPDLDAQDPCLDHHTQAARTDVGAVEISVTPDFVGCAHAVPTPWHITATPRKVAVGQLAMLRHSGSGAYLFPVMLIRIRAVERGWVEFSAQIDPSEMRTAGRQYLHIRAPISKVDLPFTFLFWYMLHYKLLPSILKRKLSDSTSSLSFWWNVVW